MTNLPEKQQTAWLNMAAAKNTLVKELESSELVLQQTLLSPTDLPATLSSYKKLHAEMVEKRKGFTSAIQTGLIEPLMAYEKRSDPKNNERFRELERKELSDRQIANAKAQAENAKNKEVADFKAHVQNEYHRICNKLRNDVGADLQKQYEMHLRENVSPDLNSIKKMLDAIPVDNMQKFPAAFLTKEDMLEIFNTIAKPNYKDIYNSFNIEEHFANFESDKKNADAAIKNGKERQLLYEMQNNRALATETSLTTIIAASEVAEVVAPKIKKEMKIVIEESEQWAKAVMAEFIIRMPFLQKYIRVKSWSKLSVGQMGEYLAKFVTETGNLINSLRFEEVQK